MAQAARLSLRMQKEVKLLLTDPPPGAYFPSLSDSSPSLSSLRADIEGPEGTVYEKGLFRLQIQIPDRYPFQPPVVTFSTPIYHPNIDNGGRICLDILNLPPKGAWQPSLNISTVLTSIGLLLSEPNPDDGLMCEVSKEYKYNRHAFDQKARSMTEKFARAGNRESNSSKNSQAQSSTSTVEAKCEVDEDFISNKKFKGNEVNEKTIDKIESSKEVCQQMVDESTQHQKKLSWTKRKLSLGSLGPSEQKVNDEKEALNTNQNSSFLNSLNVQKEGVGSHSNGRLSDGDDDVAMIHNPELLQKDFAKKTENYLNISKPKKLGLLSKRLSLSQQTDNKENTNPVQSFPIFYTNSLQLKEKHGDLVINSSKNMGGKADSGTEHELLSKLPGGYSEKQDVIEGSVLPEAVIVLDSEDSDEESIRPVRSRLMLARKRLPGKSKRKIKCRVVMNSFRHFYHYQVLNIVKLRKCLKGRLLSCLEILPLFLLILLM